MEDKEKYLFELDELHEFLIKLKAPTAYITKLETFISAYAKVKNIIYLSEADYRMFEELTDKGGN